MTSHPFTQATARELYRTEERLAARTSALHRAKTHGRPVADVIADLALEYLPACPPDVVADIGCGRGTTTRVLAERLRPRCLLAIDASAAMLAATQVRLAGHHASFLQADFHALPMRDAVCAVVVAAFCLYHAPDPRRVTTEISRVITPGGIAIMATKSIDSYSELDRIVAGAGLDTDAAARESLYGSAHSGNLPDLLPPGLGMAHLEHEEHRFTFRDPDHLAAYLATTPKYRFPSGLTGDPVPLAAALRAHWGDKPFCATSTVTYLVARREGAIG
ncbi:class I SAM-dependent methyltransferase [Thermoactinospora rubra]|uniref:class I SAM-dependent methyltransferase n=1 Tax=Thermoactinospora rubra TaxID=1088767 RepID=UPI000A11AA64|nr:methyltransferase domain-containing protein [Thermoactinospora rubra]